MARFIDKVLDGCFNEEQKTKSDNPLEDLKNASKGYSKKQIISRMIMAFQGELEKYFDDEEQVTVLLSILQTLFEVCTSDWFLKERE